MSEVKGQREGNGSSVLMMSRQNFLFVAALSGYDMVLPIEDPEVVSYAGFKIFTIKDIHVSCTDSFWEYFNTVLDTC